MSGRARLLLSSGVVAAVLAGCSSAPREYANLNQQAAEEQALTAIVLEVNQPGSALFHHHIRLRSASKSVAPDGRNAWKVVIADHTAGVSFCVYTRLDIEGIATSPQTDVLQCGGS